MKPQQSGAVGRHGTAHPTSPSGRTHIRGAPIPFSSPEMICVICPDGARTSCFAHASHEETPCLPPMAGRAVEQLSRCCRLTPRERDVLLLCCVGLKNQSIALRLGISASAVRRHLRHLHRKTRTHDKAELILNLWHSCAVIPFDDRRSQDDPNDGHLLDRPGRSDFLCE